jgi:hypothetical protein
MAQDLEACHINHFASRSAVNSKIPCVATVWRLDWDAKSCFARLRIPRLFACHSGAALDGDDYDLCTRHDCWIKERLLRTVTGAAFLYAVRQVGGKLLLPDTSRREILAGVERAGADAVRNIERGLGIVQQLTGTRPGTIFPSADAFRQSAEARLNEISNLVQPVEILERHLRNALDRVLEHQAPASTSEQYRDCILWECILDVNQDCLFVTDDGDFLDRKAKCPVLSPVLDEEGGGRVKLFVNLAEVLRSIQSQLPHIDDIPVNQLDLGCWQRCSGILISQGTNLKSCFLKRKCQPTSPSIGQAATRCQLRRPKIHACPSGGSVLFRCMADPTAQRAIIASRPTIPSDHQIQHAPHAGICD